MIYYSSWKTVCATLLVLFVITGCARRESGVPGDRLEIQHGIQIQDPGSGREEPPGSYYHYLAYRLFFMDENIEAAEKSLEQAVALDPSSILLRQELAILYIQSNKKEKALRFSEEILEMQPGNIETLIIAGSVSHAMDDLEKAVYFYKTVLEKAPDRKNIHLVLGRLYLQERRYEEAENVFQKMIERFPDEYVGYLYLGMAYARAGKPDEAIGSLERAIHLEPSLMEARFELLNIYGAREEEDKVIEIYEDIVREHPGNIAATATLGLFYLERGEADESTALFKKLGVMAGLDRSVIDTVIEVVIARKQYDEAVLLLEGMLKGLPGDPDLHYLAGISAYLADRHDEALPHLLEVTPDSRFYADAIIQTASIYVKRDNPAQAIDILEPVLVDLHRFSNPEKIRVIRYLGACYIDAGQYDNAITTLKQGLEVEPGNSDVHYELGIAYDRGGFIDKTIQHMKILIENDPDHAEALNYLGYTWAESGVRLDEAEILIRRALEIKPESGHILDSMGWVYFKKGVMEKAVLYLEKAVEKRPEDPVILEHLGDAYLGQNRRTEALVLYQRALLAMEETEDAEERQNLIHKIERLEGD